MDALRSTIRHLAQLLCFNIPASNRSRCMDGKTRNSLEHAHRAKVPWASRTAGGSHIIFAHTIDEYPKVLFRARRNHRIGDRRFACRDRC